MPKFSLPLEPMEALAVDDIPAGPGWQYEPKWDGFRVICFRKGKKVELQSKALKRLTRYFPELVAALKSLPGPHMAFDGEIVIAVGKELSFDALLQRIHPASSRIAKLATSTPATIVIFDLLADSRGDSLVSLPLERRREMLEQFLATQGPLGDRLELSPASQKRADAVGWLARTRGALDGVVAKRRDLPYAAGERSGMQKIKNYRSADCVVGGFRYAKGRKQVGSLLLGLYDDGGKLNHVGFTSSFAEKDRVAFTRKLESVRGKPSFTGKAPGGPSRWSTKEDTKWESLRPELVVEVCYDHASEGRFRHGTRLLRWRPDKSPRQCTFEQLKQPSAKLLKLLKLKVHDKTKARK